MQSNRSYYEAQVLVIPLGDDAREVLDAMLEQGLSGVMVLTDAAALRESTTRADVVVFLLSSLNAYPRELVETAAELGRDAGTPVAALTVGVEASSGDPERSAMRHLREEVDMLVSVRAPRMATSFLDVIRGGRRSAA